MPPRCERGLAAEQDIADDTDAALDDADAPLDDAPEPDDLEVPKMRTNRWPVAGSPW